MTRFEIKAIPTHYKGVEFKSRFEAKTAFLLDALKLPWEYEPESYLLDDGTPYTPDFYIPPIGLWLECRGYETEKGKREIEGFSNWICEGSVGRDKRQRARSVCTASLGNGCGGDDFSPLYQKNICDFLVIGPKEVTLYEYEPRFMMRSSEALLIRGCCGHWMFFGISGGYECRFCGKWDGDHHINYSECLRFRSGELRVGDLSSREWIDKELVLIPDVGMKSNF